MNTQFVPIRDEDVADVIALWSDCGLARPWNPPLEDIELVRASPHAVLMVAHVGGRVAGTFAVGEDGHRAWVYFLCTHPDFRRLGLARAAMQHAEVWAKARGVAKIQLLVRNSNTAVIGFYTSIGYDVGEVVQMQKWLDPDREQLSKFGV